MLRPRAPVPRAPPAGRRARRPARLEAPGEVSHELVDEPVVGREHPGELRELAHRAEQRSAVVPEDLGGVGEVVDRLVRQRPWPRRRRHRGDQVVEGPGLVHAVGPERVADPGEALVDAVDLHRGAGVVQRDVGAVLQDRALGPGRADLHEPVGDQGRPDDHRLGAGRQLVRRVVGHLDPHAVALRDHGVHGPDPDPHQAHLGALVDGDGPGEVRGERAVVVANNYYFQ